ncbi:MAG: apolipoprotein N-acyltransferase, partial [Acidimicrobiales bacterium]
LRPVRVALVQGGGRRGTRAIFTDPQVVFDRHMAASASIQRPVDLVVWPEAVLQSKAPFRDTEDASEVAGLATRLGATVVVGVEQDVGSGRYVNEVAAWGPHGGIVATYQKNHLVPFGEYVPYRSLLRRFFNLADVPLDAIPGHQVGYMSTPAGGLGVMISYEDFFDERARGAVRAGGQLLVVPTNTASYRSTQVPTQEVAASRIRAWETGRWLVQVTPVGYTAVVGPEGQVHQRSTLDEQTVVYATVPRETGRTVYVDVGPVPFALGALAVAVLAWALAWPGRRRSGSGHHHDSWSAHP